MKSTNDVNKPPWSIFTLWVIAVSGQTEYCTSFHFSSVLRPSQEWPLNFSQYFDGLDHENHIFSERISSWLITLTSTVQFSIVQTSTAQYSLVQFSTACHPFRKPHSLLCFNSSSKCIPLSWPSLVLRILSISWVYDQTFKTCPQIWTKLSFITNFTVPVCSKLLLTQFLSSTTTTVQLWHILSCRLHVPESHQSSLLNGRPSVSQLLTSIANDRTRVR